MTPGMTPVTFQRLLETKVTKIMNQCKADRVSDDYALKIKFFKRRRSSSTSLAGMRSIDNLPSVACFKQI